MGQPQDIPPGREQLVRQLSELSDDDRRAVVAAAERVAHAKKGPVVSWQALRAASGIMKGTTADAVEDSAHLYDG